MIVRSVWGRILLASIIVLSVMLAFHRPNAAKIFGKPKICLMHPVTSKGTYTPGPTPPDIREQPSLTQFVASLATTGEREYTYVMYIAYDMWDPVFDNDQNQQLYEERARQLVAPHQIDLHVRWVRLYGLQQRIIAIWNQLAKLAYREGCDYFFPTNDDLSLLTPRWTSLAIQELLDNRVFKNFGVVAFSSSTGSGYPTFHLTHRTHLEVFDMVYYPVHYLHGHCDPWIFDTYAVFEAAVSHRGIRIHNHAGNVPTRYPVEDTHRVQELHTVWRQHLYKWLEARGLLPSFAPKWEDIPKKRLEMWDYVHLIRYGPNGPGPGGVGSDSAIEVPDPPAQPPSQPPADTANKDQNNNSSP